MYISTVNALFAVLPLLAGWLMDLILGDPEDWPHPVIWYGKAISTCENRLNHGEERVAKGAFTAVGLILSVYLSTEVLLNVLSLLPWVKMAVEAIAIFFCLAGTTLAREVRMVFEAADRSLDEGRRQVSRIVGRDTAALSGQEVRTAALETLAENLNDGVIAPLFWYAVLGVPGMLAYKMVNTLDSMIGYHSDRYLQFGRWSARIDDIANFIPARLTAMLMIVVAGRIDLLGFVKHYGPAHASPNSGWPEAALAGILDCRFGGPHDYFGQRFDKPYIGRNDRPLTYMDMVKSIMINRRAEIVMIMLVTIVRLIFGQIVIFS